MDNNVTPTQLLRDRIWEDYNVQLGHTIWDHDRSLTIIGIDDKNPDFPLIGRLEEGLDPIPEIVHVSATEAQGRTIPSRMS